ncbi:hypothetical protein GCM10022214_00190 [Actinomadura miaoliensis]|uniref:Uncharacterized protein n=1 Tax=Actinomadura miaoliensis TaxID=430685 RepID=A0ABP7UVC2_9ACTN
MIVSGSPVPGAVSAEDGDAGARGAKVKAAPPSRASGRRKRRRRGDGRDESDAATRILPDLDPLAA